MLTWKSRNIAGKAAHEHVQQEQPEVHPNSACTTHRRRAAGLLLARKSQGVIITYYVYVASYYNPLQELRVKVSNQQQQRGSGRPIDIIWAELIHSQQQQHYPTKDS